MSQKLTRRHGLQMIHLFSPAALLTLMFLSIAPCSRADEIAMLEKGRTFFQSGKYYYAATWYEHAFKSYPATLQRREVLIMITTAYTRSGHADKAVQYLRLLRKEFPEAADSFDSGYRKPARPVVPAQTAAPVEASVPAATEFIPVRSFEARAAAAPPVVPKVSDVSGGEPRH